MHVLLLLLVPVQSLQQGDKENRKGKEAGGHRRGETNETSQFPVEMIRFRKAKIRQGRALLPT